MWISKKRFEAMERRIRDLEVDLIVSKIRTKDKLKKIDNQQAQTDLLDTVTLQDIASLLIDNKPIIREDNVKVRKEFGIR